MRRDWDYKNTMDYAVARGKAEGKAEGLAEGRAEGLAEGLAQGKEEGLAEGLARLSQEQQAIARRMLADGLPIDVVAKYTTLTEEQIRALEC